MGRTCGLVLGLTAAGIFGGHAVAQPVVRVSAQARLEARVEAAATGDTDLITATLRDDLDAPLARREVTVSIVRDGQTLRAADPWLTDDDGSVRLELPASEETQRIVVRFAGDSLYGAAEVEVVRQRALSPVELTFLSPASAVVSLDAPTLAVVVLARSRAGADSLKVALLDEQNRSLATGSTDSEGVFRATLSSSALGEPGNGTLVARADQDERRAAALTQLPIVRTRGTQLDLAADHLRADDIAWRGSLRSAGGPIGNAVIGLFADQEHIASVLTDDQGRYAHRAASPRALSERSLRLQARYDSSTPWLRSSRSAVVELAPRPLNLFALAALAPPIGCGLWLWLRRRKRTRQQRAASSAHEPSGIALGARSRRTLAPKMSVSGSVRDGRTGAPIEHARIALARHITQSSYDGRFDFEALTSGEHTLRVEADGFVPVEARVRLPHHGEWDRVEVKLEGLRSAVVRAWRPAAARVLGTPELVDVLTMRETSDVAREQGLGLSWNALTAAAERATYAAEPPRLPDLQEIEQLATRAAGTDDGANGAPER